MEIVKFVKWDANRSYCITDTVYFAATENTCNGYLLLIPMRSSVWILMVGLVG